MSTLHEIHIQTVDNALVAVSLVSETLDRHRKDIEEGERLEPINGRELHQMYCALEAARLSAGNALEWLEKTAREDAE